MKSKFKEIVESLTHSIWISEIPLAGALEMWHLTFSLQLPWSPEGLFLSRTDSFFVTVTTETCMPNRVPMMIGQQIPEDTIIPVIYNGTICTCCYCLLLLNLYFNSLVTEVSLSYRDDEFTAATKNQKQQSTTTTTEDKNNYIENHRRAIYKNQTASCQVYSSVKRHYNQFKNCWFLSPSTTDRAYWPVE